MVVRQVATVERFNCQVRSALKSAFIAVNVLHTINYGMKLLLLQVLLLNVNQKLPLMPPKFVFAEVVFGIVQKYI